jgi:hypothetical protein
MNINTQSLIQSISQFLHRYHLIVFVVIVLGALSAGIYITYQKIILSEDATGYTSPANNVNFDETTRNKLTELRPADYYIANPNEQRNIPTSGRLNPFIEK